MAKAAPLYTLADQYALLDLELPNAYKSINTVKYRLLMACSQNGNLLAAKNRFLFLVQDTEVRTLFSSLLEVPELRVTNGIKPIQSIHGEFSPNYNLFSPALQALTTLGIPLMTRTLLDNYFTSNEDPIYKLSIMASIVMLGYIKDDEINNRK